MKLFQNSPKAPKMAYFINRDKRKSLNYYRNKSTHLNWCWSSRRPRSSRPRIVRFSISRISKISSWYRRGSRFPPRGRKTKSKRSATTSKDYRKSEKSREANPWNHRTETAADPLLMFVHDRMLKLMLTTKTGHNLMHFLKSAKEANQAQNQWNTTPAGKGRTI